MLITKDEFDQVIDKILNQSEYAHLKDSIRDFISKIKKAISDWFMKLLENKISSPQNAIKVSNNLSNIFIIIGILIICAIIIIIVVKINGTFENKLKIKEILGEKISEDTTPTTLRDKAFKFNKEGNYRKAVRYDFIAVLLLMHRKNVIYLDETKTNKEIYKYLVKNKFNVSEQFQYLSNHFNHYWYGHKECSKQIYDDWYKNLDIYWNEVMNNEKKGK